MVRTKLREEDEGFCESGAHLISRYLRKTPSEGLVIGSNVSPTSEKRRERAPFHDCIIPSWEQNGQREGPKPRDKVSPFDVDDGSIRGNHWNATGESHRLSLLVTRVRTFFDWLVGLLL